ncbi:MAG: head GIN domain-containing protein [Actinomycetota bacterium]
MQGSGNAKTEPRKVSGFKEIKAGGAVNLEITVQKDFGLTIEADDNLIELIKTEVSGSTLTISTKDKVSPKTKINIKISLPELNNLDLSGASTANVSAVKTDSLKLNASGASKIKIDGEVKSVEAIASGASGIDAENLKTENAKVNSSGASNITVSPTGDLDAEASGASSVVYTVEPKTIKQNASGVSTIKKK